MAGQISEVTDGILLDLRPAQRMSGQWQGSTLVLLQMVEQSGFPQSEVERTD